MEHDASHALHSAIVAYVWYILFLIYIGRDVLHSLLLFDFTGLALAIQTSMFVLLATVLVPIFLRYALYLIVSWWRAFGDFVVVDPRASEAKQTWRKAILHWSIGVFVYVAVNAIWILAPVGRAVKS